MDEKKYTTSKEVTPEIIAGWKAKHKGIAEISNPDYKGWIRKPTRDEMREILSLQTDPITYTERILDMIWLGGDEQLLKDDEEFLSIMPEVQKVMDIKHAELKKL